MKPTVLLVERIHPHYLAQLEARTRVLKPLSYDEASLAAICEREQVEAIVIRTKGAVTRKVIKAAPRLKVIARHGIGVDHIDLAAATKAGVWVVNTPAGSRVAVAEHAWMMILALAKNALRADAAVRRGDYEIREHLKSMQLEGKTLGIIGLGRIGTTVAEIGVCAFGMNVLYTDIVKYAAKEKALKAKKVPLQTLLEKSDVVSIHTPLDKSTRNLLNGTRLTQMQKHAILINCARGAIVDTYALARALDTKHLAGAGIDVFDPEIPPPEHPLLKSDRVILSPHSAAQTPEANLNYAAVVEDVFRVLDGKRPQWPCNEVTASTKSEARRTASTKSEARNPKQARNGKSKIQNSPAR